MTGKTWPNFAMEPHCESHLAKILTRDMFLKLRDVKADKLDFSSLIWPGVKYPEQIVGVFVGNRQMYTQYAELLDPIVSIIHGVDPNKKVKGQKMIDLVNNKVCEPLFAGWTQEEMACVQSNQVECVRNLQGLPSVTALTPESEAKLKDT